MCMGDVSSQYRPVLTAWPFKLALIHRVPWDDIDVAHQVVTPEKGGQLLGLEQGSIGESARRRDERDDA